MMGGHEHEGHDHAAIGAEPVAMCTSGDN